MFRYSLIALCFIFCCTKKDATKETVITSVPVREGALIDKQSWDGTVKASTRVELRTNRKIRVGKVLVKEGDLVKKGQLLIEVDTTDDKKKLQDLNDRMAAASIDLQSTSLSLDFAKKISERKTKLSKKGIIAAKEQEEASKQLEGALSQRKSKNLEFAKLKREFEQAERDSKTAHFYAPIDGVVSNLTKADPYTDLRPGQIVGVVANPNQLSFYTEVDESRIGRVKAGQPVSLYLDAIPNQALAGKVAEVNMTASDNQGQAINRYSVKIDFKNQGTIRDGFQGKVEIIFAQKTKTLAVPIEAIKYNAGKPFLLVSNSKQSDPSPAAVQLGLLTQDEAEILTGVQAKQQVVLEVK